MTDLALEAAAVRVVHELPPVYDAIVEAIGVPPTTAIYAYGDRVYVPCGAQLPSDLTVHERTHLKQQAEAGGPEAWWERYLEDTAFRLEQEVEAYGRQVAWWDTRAARRRCLADVSRDLSGPMYGWIISRDEARSRIAAVARRFQL